MKNKPMSLLLSPPSYLSFFSPTACWKYLILTGLSFCTMSKKQKNLSFIVGFQHVHNLSLSPVLARDRRAFSKKMQANLKRLLAGQEVVQVADPDLDASFKSLSGKLNL